MTPIYDAMVRHHGHNPTPDHLSDKELAAMTELTLERKHETDPHIVGPFAITPPIDEDYWAYRVRLSGRQAIVGFPKFGTVGIGFAVEDDWNTNLPCTCDAAEIYEHIEHNKGDDSISRDDCIAAIRLVQDAVRADREATDDRR